VIARFKRGARIARHGAGKVLEVKRRKVEEFDVREMDGAAAYGVSLQKRGKRAPFQNRTAVVEEKHLRRDAWFESRVGASWSRKITTTTRVRVVCRLSPLLLSLCCVFLRRSGIQSLNYLPKKRV
jgi:hypothetical protein